MRSRRGMIGLALLLVLLGTPARQAEAAADLARTASESGQDDRVEEVDGGVGDDQLEAPRGDSSIATAALVISPGSTDSFAPLESPRLIPIRSIARSRDRPPPPCPTSLVRLATLQRFRC